jgi:thiamine monophosphate kinase
MRLRFLGLLLAGAVVATASTAAHHSFAASYREEASVTIEGELVQLVLRNPHSFMHVIVKARGSEVRYAIEWTAAGDLGSQGVTRETLSIGDYIVVTGSPSRAETDNRIRLTSLRRPSDGFSWEAPPMERFRRPAPQ